MKKMIFAILALGAANTAQADIIPTITVASPVQVGNLFRYTYTATLSADQSLQTGNFFTIYDFQGFVKFGTTPVGFSATSSLIGQTPAKVLPNDDPTVRNATFTYSGPSINDTPGDFEGVSTQLGSFQIFSRFDGLGFIDFASLGTKNNGFADGTAVANVGLTAGPLAGSGNPNGVPEPSVWAMLVIGFGAVGIVSA
jgi:hypothetical protein